MEKLTQTKVSMKTYILTDNATFFILLFPIHIFSFGLMLHCDMYCVT